MKFIPLIIIIFSLGIVTSLEAQGTTEAPAVKKRNPFAPQLPVVKKAPKPEPKPEPKPDIKKTDRPKIKPRDPKPTLSNKLPTVSITGIIWNSRRPQAIINGRVIDIGDTIEDMKIIAIRKTGIDVSFRGASKTLKVN